jgi:hypothetical protein
VQIVKIGALKFVDYNKVIAFFGTANFILKKQNTD